MSAITTSPQCGSAGGSTSGSFGTASVTVSVASMCGPVGSALSADSPDGRSIDTTGRSAALMSATTVSKSPASGVFSPVPKSASTSRSQPRISEKWSSQAWRVVDLDDRVAEVAEDLEIDARVAAHFGDGADQERRHVDAALQQRPRDDESVAAVVAAAAEHRDAGRRASANIASIAATTWRPAFSIRTIDGMPIVLDGAAIGFPHLRAVQDSHVRLAVLSSRGKVSWVGPVVAWVLGARWPE